jgi:hypothetical protein
VERGRREGVPIGWVGGVGGRVSMVLAGGWWLLKVVVVVGVVGEMQVLLFRCRLSCLRVLGLNAASPLYLPHNLYPFSWFSFAFALRKVVVCSVVVVSIERAQFQQRCFPPWLCARATPLLSSPKSAIV